MRLKSHHHGHRVMTLGVAQKTSKDLLMAAVHAIKHADRDTSGFSRDPFIVKPVVNSHQDLLPAVFQWIPGPTPGPLFHSAPPLKQKRLTGYAPATRESRRNQAFRRPDRKSPEHKSPWNN